MGSLRCRVVDLTIVAGLTVASVAVGVLVGVLNEGGPGMGFATAAVVLQVLTSPVLLARHRAPVVVTCVVAASAVVQILVSAQAPGDLPLLRLSADVWLPVALSIAVGAMAERGVPARRAAPAWVLIGLVTVAATQPWAPDPGIVLNGLVHTAVPALAGLYLAARRRLLSELRDRAERAERERILLAAQARAEERARLAAEMHDVVAHRVTLMVLQAGALGVNAPDPATRAAAEELRGTGRRALTELSELVGVLRSSGSDTAPTRDAPAPALAELVEDSASVGLPVDLVEDGDVSRLSPVVGRTAHRVVQEALTNVRKHARGASVHVDARYGPETVRVSVRNTAGNGPDPAIAGSGSRTGLAGLRERVELVGGTLAAGPDGEGGFRVEATMPARVAGP